MPVSRTFVQSVPESVVESASSFAPHPMLIFHFIPPHAIPTQQPQPTHPIPSTPPHPTLPRTRIAKLRKHHSCHGYSPSIRFISCMDCRSLLCSRHFAVLLVLPELSAVCIQHPKSHDGQSYFAGIDFCRVCIELSAGACCFGILGAESFVNGSAHPIVVYRCVQGDRRFVGGTEEDARREGAAR